MLLSGARTGAGSRTEAGAGSRTEAGQDWTGSTALTVYVWITFRILYCTVPVPYLILSILIFPSSFGEHRSFIFCFISYSITRYICEPCRP